MANFREIRVPEDLCTVVEAKFAPRFARVEDLVIFALQELAGVDAGALDQREQELIEQRLRDLGYL